MGDVSVSIPRVKSGMASFAAIRVRDAGGNVIREAFRSKSFHDKAGEVWEPISIGGSSFSSIVTSLLPRVKNDGTRLVLLTSGGDDACAAARALADEKLLTFSGPVGASGPSWLGFWFFGRKHWLLDGLPSDCVLDWPYQIGSGNGILISGHGVETVVGYGRDHTAKIGTGASVIQCGKGQIVLLGLPGLTRAFVQNDGSGFHPVTAKRILYNASQSSKSP